MKQLGIFINEENIFDYDKAIELEQNQLSFFDKMDSDMNRGVKIQGELINSPDAKQRATFVVMNLLKALRQENEMVISASCAYLSQRMPALTEVHANDDGAGIKVEFLESL